MIFLLTMNGIWKVINRFIINVIIYYILFTDTSKPVPEKHIEDIAAANEDTHDSDYDEPPPAKKPKPNESKAGSSGNNKSKPSTSTTTTSKTPTTTRINPTTSTPQKSKPTSSTENNANTSTSHIRNLSEEISPTAEATPVTGDTNKQQVETPRGPEHNTKGTLQGESGNRKIQKPIIRYGVIKVNMSEQTYIFCFQSKDDTDNCCDVLDMHWPNIKILCYSEKFNDISNHDFAVSTEYFICCVQLGFRINWTTLKSKLGEKILTDIKYFQRQTIKESMDHPDEFKSIITGNLKVCFRNKIPSIDFNVEIEKENNFKKKFSSSSDATEPILKRHRWN